jgi:hypothetical protein
MQSRSALGLVLVSLFIIFPSSSGAVGWASETLSAPEGNPTNLFGISCTSTSFCMSAGSYEDPFLERDVGTSYKWNGSSWSNLGGLGLEHPVISGIACTSSSFCVMVGSYGEIETEGTLALHWNGSEWKVVTTPNPGSFFPQILEGVSCTAATACTAVGWKQASGSARETLVIRWNGTSWSSQSSPNPGTTENLLHGVSCTSSTHCVAVGAKSSGGGTTTTLAMTWNGTTWSTQTTPNPTGALSASTEAVSCISSSACTAVGVYQASNGPLPFAMRWNGTSWSLESVKLPAETNFGWLKGVSCVSSTFCMGVGAYERIGQGTFTMAQKWNGTSWSAEKPANPGKAVNELRALSCTASNWCNAAGFYISGENIASPFIDHFSG